MDNLELAGASDGSDWWGSAVNPPKS